MKNDAHLLLLLLSRAIQTKKKRAYPLFEELFDTACPDNKLVWQPCNYSFVSLFDSTDI